MAASKLNSENGVHQKLASVENHSADEDGKTDVDDDVDVRCGFGSWKPDWLQNLNRPCSLVVLLGVIFFGQGFVVNGVNNVNTATIERRFHLTSSQVAAVSSSYDFGAAIFGFIISFLGSGRHKARWLAMAAVLLSLGSLVMALPHFITDRYEWGELFAETCSENEISRQCGEEKLGRYLYVMCLGQILHGAAGGTIYTVGIAFVDDSVVAVNSPLYMGILYGTTLLGPGLGFIVGGQLLNIYVDFHAVDTKSIDLTPEDPRWVGAWWIGFLINFVLVLLLAIPFAAFGAELPTAKFVRETRVSQTHEVSGTEKISHDPTKRRPLKELPAAVWNLLKTPPFTFIMLAGCSEGMLVAGVATFLPKFIQNQYAYTASWAALLAGFVTVPGAAGGSFVGGLVCKKMKLKVRGMMKFSIITSLIFIVISPVFWAMCAHPPIAGVNTNYNGSSEPNSLASECNGGCHCSTEFYDPVCDEGNNIQYFSACHAGCLLENSDLQSYSNCSCVTAPVNTNTSTVKSGSCPFDCNLAYVFLPLGFVLIFTTFLASTPSDAATLRCIDDSQRPFSMGLKWLVLRLTGTVPGPFVFGAVTDQACLVWGEKCGERSSCWIYDNSAMSRNYFLIIVAIKIISLIFFTLANFTYIPPRRTKELTELTDLDTIGTQDGTPVSDNVQ